MKEKKSMSPKAKEFWRAVKFLLFSISAGAIQMGSFALLNELTPWGDEPFGVCYLVSLLLSIIWNFTLNRRFTFQSANNVPVAMAKTLAFYVVFTPATIFLGNYLTGTLGWNDYLVEFINMCLNFVLEFLYQRFYVFKDSMDTREQ